ncbi:hypothetical protein BDR26DRAFT_1014404 [Obelidium mucronatum]|nr:hypothetical protein BDR26DRAFT_1014404 [Obelidium mucronatum]
MCLLDRHQSRFLKTCFEDCVSLLFRKNTQARHKPRSSPFACLWSKKREIRHDESAMNFLRIAALLPLGLAAPLNNWNDWGDDDDDEETTTTTARRRTQTTAPPATTQKPAPTQVAPPVVVDPVPAPPAPVAPADPVPPTPQEGNGSQQQEQQQQQQQQQEVQGTTLSGQVVTTSAAHAVAIAQPLASPLPLPSPTPAITDTSSAPSASILSIGAINALAIAGCAVVAVIGVVLYRRNLQKKKALEDQVMAGLPSPSTSSPEPYSDMRRSNLQNEIESQLGIQLQKTN